MKPEEKDLLLKDLCARLPYKVVIEHEGNLSVLDTIFMCDSISISSTSIDKRLSYNLDLDEFKPYLFPLSSMTQEQKNSHNFLKHSAYANPIKLVDFYNKHHLDYRGLIPKGLANDATNKNIY